MPSMGTLAHSTGRAQVGRQEPVMVLRVDKDKGYIDLSKRRVSPEDIAAAEERFNKSKMVRPPRPGLSRAPGAVRSDQANISNCTCASPCTRCFLTLGAWAGTRAEPGPGDGRCSSANSVPR